MNQQLRITVSGDLEGDFVVIGALSEDEYLIARESSVPSLKNARKHSGSRPATAEEFAAFEADHGPFLPPDGEEMEPDDQVTNKASARRYET